jgi:hypothetical protein
VVVVAGDKGDAGMREGAAVAAGGRREQGKTIVAAEGEGDDGNRLYYHLEGVSDWSGGRRRGGEWTARLVENRGGVLEKTVV